MERFYLVRTGNDISIKDGATHELLCIFLSMDKKEDIIKEVKKLASMTNEQYIIYAIEHKARLRTIKNEFETKEEEKKWYEGAWKSTTEKTLKEIGLSNLKIPECISPLEVNEVKKAMKTVKKQAEKDSLNLNEIEEPKATNDIDKKPFNKPAKHLAKKTVPKKKPVPKKDIKEEQLKDLKESFNAGEISFRDYKNKQRLILGENTKKKLIKK